MLAGREIIFEIRVSGGSAQVCALDCATGIEVFVTTPANAMRKDQHDLALRKLTKALVDQGVVQLQSPTQENSGPQVEMPPSSKRGFLA